VPLESALTLRREFGALFEIMLVPGLAPWEERLN